MKISILRSLGVFTFVGMAGFAACTAPEPGIDAAAAAIRTEAAARSSVLARSALRVDGLLMADPDSCACFKVCDGNGENCAECICDPAGCADCDELDATGSDLQTLASLAINTGPLKIKLDETNPPAECTDPRPDDVGCTTICKPCLTFICVDGEWEGHSIDFPEGVCDPVDPGEPRPNGCPRDENNFCPAECSFCY